MSFRASYVNDPDAPWEDVKDEKCEKCGSTLQRLPTWYEGDVNFQHTVTRCPECKWVEDD